jgi:uncharacterized protein YggE
MKIASIAAVAAALGVGIAFAGVGRPGPAHGSGVPAPSGRTVTAEGVGTARTVPDTAQVSFGVETVAATASEALAANAEKMRRVLAVLRENGIARADLQTQDVSVYPHQNSSGVQDGFDASTTVSATVRRIGATGKIIDAANAAGAQNTSGPSFSRSSRAELTQRALRVAFENARAKARVLARMAGGHLGAVQRIEEASPVAQPMPIGFDAVAEARTPIEPGTQTVQQTVTVTFSLE